MQISCRQKVYLQTVVKIRLFLSFFSFFRFKILLKLTLKERDNWKTRNYEEIDVHFWLRRNNNS